jgi:hypothetical protein
MDKIKTSIQNAKSHTLWKKRMEAGKPREGDYNFVIWENNDEIIVEPWNKLLPPSVFKNGEWIMLAEKFREDNDGR